MSELTFKGNTEQQALAAQVYRLMTAQGAMFAADAPIRQTLSNLADFFASQRKTDASAVRDEIDAALRENDMVFAREQNGDDVIYVTSKQGRYAPRVHDNKHMFKRRLYEPDNPLPIDDISVVVTTTRPALTTVEPVFISDYWQRAAGILPPEGDETAEAIDVVDGAASDGALVDGVLVDAEELVATAEQPDEAVLDTAPVAEAVVVEAPAPVAALPSTVMTLPNGVQVDLRRPAADLMAQYGNTLVTQLRNALENDPLRRIVLFGNDVYPETMVANFGKNDLRRIRDYIQQERQQPLLDTEIIADLFYHNPRQNDYESFRFALNYRLSKEKDFEFVGVEGARLWSAKGLPSLGSKRIKASEMGQIAGYLEEGFDDSLRDQNADSIRRSGQLTHILSFFEWEYGVLPFTRALAALLPSPLLQEQRTAVLRFDSPQRYTSTLVELRYPTGNRGGWLAGFEAFFHENLVPGAMLTLSRTDEPQVFTVSYEEQPEVSDRLLVLDERKNKFAFANIPYFVVVDTDMLVNQQQYGRLRNLKSLPMGERRKSDQVLEHVFETIGEPVGTRSEPRYLSSTQDLYVAMNVLRPTSTSYLEHLLKDGERFSPDDSTPGAWYYEPEVVETDDDEDEDDDYDYDDDE